MSRNTAGSELSPILPLLPEFQPWEDTVNAAVAAGATRIEAWEAADAAHPELVTLAMQRGTVTADPPPFWWSMKLKSQQS